MLRESSSAEMTAMLSVLQISVIMPVYNMARFLERAVASVLDQDVASLELLLVDGGSTDGSLALAQQLSARNRCIRVHANAGVRRVNGARNLGLEQAQGRYIAFLRGDEVYERGALKARLRSFANYPDTALVHGPARFVDECDRDQGIASSHRKTLSFLDATLQVHMATVMGERGLLQALRFEEDMVYGGDWAYFAAALRTGAESRYVEDGAALCRMPEQSPDLDEMIQYDRELRAVIDRCYSVCEMVDVAPRYRRGLVSPPITAVKRYRDLAFFLWGFINAHLQVCRRLMEDAGFMAFLNILYVPTFKEMLRSPFAERYRFNFDQAATALSLEQKRLMLRHAGELQWQAKAPVLFSVLCRALDLRVERPASDEEGQLDVSSPEYALPAGGRLLTPITSFYTKMDADIVLGIVDVLLANCRNPLLDATHILLEGDLGDLDGKIDAARMRELRTNLGHGRIVISPIAARPNYAQLFAYANSLGVERMVAVINADIVIDPAAARLILAGRQDKGSPFYALSRWNKTPSGNYLMGWPSSPPWPEWTVAERSFYEKGFGSFDCYVFDTPLAIPESLAEVMIATYACDTAISSTLKVAGVAVHNPCLTVKTIHIDDKPRNYVSERGLKDLAVNVQAFEAALSHRYCDQDSVLQSLDNLAVLSPGLAWLGGPANHKPRETLFIALGALPWETLDRPTVFREVRISIENGNLDGASEKIARIPEFIADNVFITWELHGFQSAAHVCDYLVNHESFEAFGYQLFRYQWQAMVHRDLASGEAQRVLDDMRRIIVEVLCD